MAIDQTTIDLWFHYEEVAMHFNSLIMQYRLQLMGGIGVIGTLSGYLIGEKVTSHYHRHMLRALVSAGLLILIFAAATLDLYYYNELLRGAVDALLEIEKEHKELNLSTSIKARFPHGATTIIKYVYALIILPMLAFVVWSWVMFIKEHIKRKRNENQANK